MKLFQIKNYCRIALGASLFLFAIAQRADAQSCALSISKPNDIASVTIQAAPWFNGNTNASANPSFVLTTVNTNNAGIADAGPYSGAYLGWCVDMIDGITGVSTKYAATLYSSCDPNIDTDLPQIYPTSVLDVSPTVWHQINYLLNHKNGAYFYDIQVAIWELETKGAPIPANLLNGDAGGYPYPKPTGQYQALYAAAVANAAGWQEACGDVIAVVVSVSSGTTTPDQLTIIEVPYPCTQVVCCPPPQQKCGWWGGSIWCNGQISCNPGKPCTITCQNASVTITCSSGHTYTYPIPNCQVNFSSKCSTATSCYQNGQWCTTVPCSGDSQIFLSGCGIPWQNDFNNCQSICWTGEFNCSTPGVSCQWQCASSCYNCDLSNCNTVQPKPCAQNYCGWNNNNDCAGTPENYKSYCSNGNNNGWNNGWNWNGWNNSYCGNWSNPGWCQW